MFKSLHGVLWRMVARGRSNVVQQRVRRVQEAGHSNDCPVVAYYFHMNFVDEMLHVLPFSLCLSCITKRGHLVWMHLMLSLL